MLYSMTGYGKSTLTLENKKFSIEIKSLNSKSLDLNFKIPTEIREKEIEIRKLISTTLIRGKVEVFFLEEKSTTQNSTINFKLVEQYYQELKTFSIQKNIPLGNEILQTILRMQEVTKTEALSLETIDFSDIEEAFTIALETLQQHRKDEGQQLEKDILQNIKNIQQLKNELPLFEKNRIDKIRDKFHQELELYLTKNIIDKNRLEEELIYYIEKMDINEEKIRLETHLDYFIKMVHEENIEKGKKLGFIAQEMGREINTIGSKANDAEMQKRVILMKDELEKIKEQLMNII